MGAHRQGIFTLELHKPKTIRVNVLCHLEGREMRAQIDQSLVARQGAERPARGRRLYAAILLASAEIRLSHTN